MEGGRGEGDGTNMGGLNWRGVGTLIRWFDSMAYSKISNFKIPTRIFSSPVLSSPNFSFFFPFFLSLSLATDTLYFVHPRSLPIPFFHSCKFHGIIEFSVANK